MTEQSTGHGTNQVALPAQARALLDQIANSTQFQMHRSLCELLISCDLMIYLRI
jgi:hypothetical protein